jgi:hypothetical protein
MVRVRRLAGEIQLAVYFGFILMSLAFLINEIETSIQSNADRVIERCTTERTSK